MAYRTQSALHSTVKRLIRVNSFVTKSKGTWGVSIKIWRQRQDIQNQKHMNKEQMNMQIIQRG